jgi:hypothetical protein
MTTTTTIATKKVTTPTSPVRALTSVKRPRMMREHDGTSAISPSTLIVDPLTMKVSNHLSPDVQYPKSTDMEPSNPHSITSQRPGIFYRPNHHVQKTSDVTLWRMAPSAIESSYPPPERPPSGYHRSHVTTMGRATSTTPSFRMLQSPTASLSKILPGNQATIWDGKIYVESFPPSLVFPSTFSVVGIHLRKPEEEAPDLAFM